MVAPVANAVLFVADLAALAWVRRGAHPVRVLALLAIATTLLWIGGRAAFGWNMFAMMQVLAWAVFAHAPAVLALGSARSGAAGPGLAAIALAAVGFDAFFVEPRWLEVAHRTIPAPKLTERVRVALVTDLQTDGFGEYERDTLRKLKAEAPDLVIFAGDYVQTHDEAVFQAASAAIAGELADLAPRLGAFAVRGDVDNDRWEADFQGTVVVPVKESRSFDVGPLVVTALSPEDVRSGHPPVEATDKYHLVFAHRPDFALAQPPGDLLLAGHVHGGQVRIPGFGPLLTLTEVPRAWAVGYTRLPWGADLYVSRGIGMERFDAPRIRFNCRPELAILDLVPAR